LCKGLFGPIRGVEDGSVCIVEMLNRSKELGAIMIVRLQKIVDLAPAATVVLNFFLFLRERS